MKNLPSVIGIKTIQELGLQNPRIIMEFEADEESGKIKEKIGQVDLVIALDASCESYDRKWVTTTLRGIVVGTVTVQVLNENFRQLLYRIENLQTGDVVDDFQVIIPGEQYLEGQKTAEVFKEVITKFPFHKNTQPVYQDHLAYLNKIWRAQLLVIGRDDLPVSYSAENVITPKTTLKLSLRLLKITQKQNNALLNQYILKFLFFNQPQIFHIMLPSQSLVQVQVQDLMLQTISLIQIQLLIKNHSIIMGMNYTLLETESYLFDDSFISHSSQGFFLNYCSFRYTRQ
ncbi:unnamed protein product (macronuclear) [Paramecium tetraurelia]|uniref:Uncharacterized protein n=1 Tax=Paramecium tetraurelia TaxID=5888 RepID=A0BHA0_PARTE|nr:uncharacterized protein GSPATT00028952001 [Paramecium tetraurelia]CAK57917.1 unnamed protein product [Paramecium tetraurelia]|eukprot:XP_001425315.1 hypothetical protein (macronuclear) [Paramecium tetraurelia strain d4-2]